jgi:hypothetical protein
MIGKICFSPDWGIKGVIQKELDDSWGIFWIDIPVRLIQKFGYPNYWQKKVDIVAIEEEIDVRISLTDQPISPGDLFFYRQLDNSPTFRIAKPKEDWNGFTNCKTGENPYKKVSLIRPL